MLYYGVAILIAIVIMLIVSIRLLRRSILFGILFTGFFLILLLFHGSNLVQALALSRPANPHTVANSK